MIVRREIERAREMSAAAFNVDPERLTGEPGCNCGHRTKSNCVCHVGQRDARRCVAWVLAGRGYTVAEIARALRRTPRFVREAIAHTERVLKIHPKKREALAA